MGPRSSWPLALCSESHRLGSLVPFRRLSLAVLAPFPPAPPVQTSLPLRNGGLPPHFASLPSPLTPLPRWASGLLPSWVTCCHSARAIVTKYHTLGDLNSRLVLLTVLEATNSRSRCQQVWLLLRPLSVACGLTALSCVCPWSPSVLVCVHISCSYKDTPHTGLGPTLTDPILTK